MTQINDFETLIDELRRTREHIFRLESKVSELHSSINDLNKRQNRNGSRDLIRKASSIIDRLKYGPAPELFDKEWYKQTYADVGIIGVDPWVHFKKHGERESRNPNVLFSTSFYIESNPDVKHQRVSPLAHYMKTGWREGRNPHPFFDVKWYLENNLDVKSLGVEPLSHFLRYGINEGRMPNRLFDSEWYQKLRPDIKAANLTAIQHYVLYGIAEGQAWHPPLNHRVDKYINFNPERRSYSFSIEPAPYTYIPLRPSRSALEFIAKHSADVKFSIIVPVYNTPQGLLDKAYESVKSQWYNNWEIIFVNDRSTDVRVSADLSQFARQDHRVSVVETTINMGIAGATNVAISASTGDYIVFLDHDDELTNDCLYELAKRIKQTSADFLYSDEDKIDEQGRYVQPFFKPNWSPDTLMSTMYTCHVSCVKRSLAVSVGPLAPELDGAQDWDFILRVSEKASRIEHIPKVLYHWRVIPNSIASDLNAKPKAVEHGKLARERALGRRHHSGQMCHIDDLPNHYAPVYSPKPGTLVSIIIPTKNNFRYISKCVSSILSVTDYHNFEITVIDNGSSDEDTLMYLNEIANHKAIQVLELDAPFNFSALCNFGASASSGDVYVFLNDDTEILERGWLGAVVGQAQLEHTGAVGAKLIYGEENTIQHNGILNLEPGPCHAFSRQSPKFPGYFGRSVLPYNWIAVTGALLVVEKSKFAEIGGFDETFPVAYNDIDLCFRLKRAGWHNVNLPFVQLIHHESVSRGIDHESADKARRLKREKVNLYVKHPGFYQNDPYYNVNMHPLDVHFDLSTKWNIG